LLLVNNEGKDQFLWDSNSTSDLAVSSGDFTVTGSTLKFVQWDGKDSTSGNVTISGNGNTITLSGFTSWTRLNGTWYKNGASVSSGTVTLESVTANGSASHTTTELVLIFNERINGLSAADITLSGVAGVTKGTLTGGPKYVLPISGFTAGGTLNVAVAKSGFTFSGSPKTVPIYALNWDATRDVYVVGYSKDGGVSKATIWKNGVKTLLSTSESYAYSVYVSGSDVYVAGHIGSSTTGSTNSKATLWKNGTAQTLSSSAAIAKSVVVSGSDVYVAGNTISASRRAVYWKNGNQTTLNTPTISGSSVTPLCYGNSISVSGSNVYVVGEARGTSYLAALWINGTPYTISAAGSEFTSVFISGSDVYMTAHPSTKATLFKTTTGSTSYTSTQLASQNSFAESVFVSGSDVYVAGQISGSGARLWKNGVAQTLSSNGGDSGLSVYVYGSDTYVAGRGNTTGDGATLWINGQARYLDEGSSMAYGVFVKAR